MTYQISLPYPLPRRPLRARHIPIDAPLHAIDSPMISPWLDQMLMLGLFAGLGVGTVGYSGYRRIKSGGSGAGFVRGGGGTSASKVMFAGQEIPIVKSGART